jgi:uncharacterized membrane protein YedE/YeeE
MEETRTPKRFWNPYVAGVALGLVLLTAFVVTGRGLGASGAASRVGVTALDSVASSHVNSNAYMAKAKEGNRHPLDSWFVFMALGVILGGFVAAFSAGRLQKEVIRGPRISSRNRLLLALGGGALMGVGARLALGCTSGQALTGGALLSVGSWIFMMAVFAGGYAFAMVVRKEWL